MKNFKIALDWTANTNHTGFYVAKEKGFYKTLGLNVDIITPAADNYAVTPAKKVELGQADVALCPFESIVSYRTKKKTFDAVALATIFREDMSAIATLSNSGIHSPKDLDGCVYASYKARYEDEMVRQMIRNDGGEGKFEITYPEKLGIWNTILKKKADATWIFRNWEGVQAENNGIALRLFKMEDFGIPYGYSPVIMGSYKAIRANEELYQRFLGATKKGYMFAKANPDTAVECISPFVAEQDKNIDLVQSQKVTSNYYGDMESWGVIEEAKVNLFLDWLYNSELEKTKMTFKELVF